MLSMAYFPHSVSFLSLFGTPLFYSPECRYSSRLRGLWSPDPCLDILSFQRYGTLFPLFFRIAPFLIMWCGIGKSSGPLCERTTGMVGRGRRQPSSCGHHGRRFIDSFSLPGGCRPGKAPSPRISCGQTCGYIQWGHQTKALHCPGPGGEAWHSLIGEWLKYQGCVDVVNIIWKLFQLSELPQEPTLWTNKLSALSAYFLTYYKVPKSFTKIIHSYGIVT